MKYFTQGVNKSSSESNFVLGSWLKILRSLLDSFFPRLGLIGSIKSSEWNVSKRDNACIILDRLIRLRKWSESGWLSSHLRSSFTGSKVFEYNGRSQINNAKLFKRRECNNCGEAQPNRPLLHSRRLNNDHYIKTFSVIRCNNYHYCKKFCPEIAIFRIFLQ